MFTRRQVGSERASSCGALTNAAQDGRKKLLESPRVTPKLQKILRQQQVLDDNKEAYIEYLISHSGSGLRVKNKDQELLSSTRLSSTATDDLERRLSGKRRLASDAKRLNSDTFV